MNLDRPMKFLCVGVSFAVIGMGLALISGAVLAKSYRATLWPRTTARVVRSEVEKSQRVMGYRRGAPIIADYWKAKIDYEFTVQGQTHVGHEIKIAEMAEGYKASLAEDAVAKYPLGSEVTISYNPRKPSNALIDPTVAVGMYWVGVAAGLTSLLAGAVLWFMALRLDDARRAAARAAKAPLPVPEIARVKEPAVPARPAAPPAPLKPLSPAQKLIFGLLRTAAVLAGLLFFLIGSLSLSLSTQLSSPAANSPTQETIHTIAHVITVGIVAGVLGFGALLIWLGMRRTTRPTRPLTLAAGR